MATRRNIPNRNSTNRKVAVPRVQASPARVLVLDGYPHDVFEHLKGLVQGIRCSYIYGTGGSPNTSRRILFKVSGRSYLAQMGRSKIGRGWQIDVSIWPV